MSYLQPKDEERGCLPPSRYMYRSPGATEASIIIVRVSLTSLFLSQLTKIMD